MGGNSPGSHKGGAGGGALKISAPTITIGPAGAIHVDGGDGGEAAAPAKSSLAQQPPGRLARATALVASASRAVAPAAPAAARANLGMWAQGLARRRPT
eukprot:scaffold34277_cov63-Phaeocystis_antarctica.AAC.2